MKWFDKIFGLEAKKQEIENLTEKCKQELNYLDRSLSNRIKRDLEDKYMNLIGSKLKVKVNKSNELQYINLLENERSATKESLRKYAMGLASQKWKGYSFGGEYPNLKNEFGITTVFPEIFGKKSFRQYFRKGWNDIFDFEVQKNIVIGCLGFIVSSQPKKLVMTVDDRYYAPFSTYGYMKNKKIRIIKSLIITGKFTLKGYFEKAGYYTIEPLESFILYKNKMDILKLVK